MTIPEDLLMAYLDGELDAAQRARVEAALAADPALAERVRRQRELQQRLAAAYAPVLDEPVPAALQAAVSPGARTNVVPMRTDARARRRWSWPEWTAIAASLVVGVFASTWLRDSGEAQWLRMADGGMTAGPQLDRALRTAMSGATQGPVSVTLSFRSRDGGYCRAFTLQQPRPLGGLACQRNGQWQVPVLAEAAHEGGELRQASSALPQAVLDEVDARITGDPLDADDERLARERGWRP